MNIEVYKQILVVEDNYSSSFVNINWNPKCKRYHSFLSVYFKRMKRRRNNKSWFRK